MNGDLCLSQALGGLRIANPDADGADATQSSHHSPSYSDQDICRTYRNATSSEIGNHDSVQDINHSSESHFSSSNVSRFTVSSSFNPSEPSVSIPKMLIGKERQGSQPITRQHSYTPRSNATVSQRRISQEGGSGSAPLFASAVSPVPPTNSEEWKDRGAAIGLRREIDATGRSVVRQVKKGVRDFSFGRILGEGSYSTVYLATDRQTLKEYAVKVLEKRHIIKEKKIKYVNIEKNTLNRLTEHPGIVRLYYTFQDETSLYYVLDLCNGGELLGVLKKTGTFDVDCAKFYGAQILDSIDYMHSRGVIHRDLKPENVLLDDQMHVKITDFGTAKLLPDRKGSNDDLAGQQGSSERDGRDAEHNTRAASFVGTAEYVSPELLTHKSACKASDLWAFGCIIYQLLAGRPPFKAGSEYLTFQKIVNLDYSFPQGFPKEARDLVERCLVRDPAQRLTIEHIKNHEFFAGQIIDQTLWRTKAPRLRPYNPPTQEPAIIQLNGFAPATNASHHSVPETTPRPQAGSPHETNRPARIITELPPPTQLDIEWSPVLIRHHERILRLGDLMVVSAPLYNASHRKGSDEGHKKLSRFFGGSTTKKRQRLVIVTSSGRILLAPAGGAEKRAKQELSLLSPDCSWRSHQDAKGQPVWCVDTAGLHYTFEDTRISGDLSMGKKCVDEWIECLERARDLAVSQNEIAHVADAAFIEMSSSITSPANTVDGKGSSTKNSRPVDRVSNTQGIIEDSMPKRNRFSKRQSRNGPSSIF